MENKQCLLSICIPTYNRAKVLQQTIQTIVSDIDFDEEVELIISDNCSTDETEKMVSKFCKEYKNVFYYRNETNILDKNFSKTLSYGNGAYLKLQNDNLIFSPGAIQLIKGKIKEELVTKTPLFFTGNRIFTRKKEKAIYCYSLDDYVQAISTFVTWIGAFGVWREQFMALPDKDKYAGSSLAQNGWSYRIMSTYQKCIIHDFDIYACTLGPLGVRRGYNFFQVHLDNYYMIMQPYLISGEISKKTYYQDRKYLLSHFKKELFGIFVYKYDTNFGYDTSDTLAVFWRYYKDIPLFYLYLMIYPFCLLIVPFLYAIKGLLSIPCLHLLAKTIYHRIKKDK
jgi:glycosyltransferase involved in cell wall biosynthesis